MTMQDEPRPRSARGPIKLSHSDKWLIYSAAVLVWLSGALWLFYIYFMRVEGEFGLEQDPLEAVWQKVHGIVGYLAAFALGTMWGVHVVRGWQARWRRWTGGTLFRGRAIPLAERRGALLHRQRAVERLDGNRPLGRRPRRAGGVPDPLAVEVAAEAVKMILI